MRFGNVLCELKLEGEERKEVILQIPEKCGMVGRMSRFRRKIVGESDRRRFGENLAGNRKREFVGGIGK
jgi:hypothetical protein